MVDVDVINKAMKKIFAVILLLVSMNAYTQDSTAVYKKRVLENIEIDFLTSYYTQDGNNAAVTGGIGSEKITDITPTFVIAIPLNDDDVLIIDAGISAYTSASSSNLDPFDKSGASSRDDGNNNSSNTKVVGSPWVASSGASQADSWKSLNANYSHSSDDRNTVLSANISLASEYDYTSFGFGGGYTKLFNEKNTEISISGKVFLDSWQPQYATEINSYIEAGESLNNGFFSGIPILDQNGDLSVKSGADSWSPINTTLLDNTSRNTYSLSMSFSQILSRNAQFSLFFDVVNQSGWLANPMQRVYFGDRDNYYIGEPESIPNYTSSTNKDVFQLADDIERLPSSKFKLPIGARLNYFLSERFVLRTYYRFYTDDWGVTAHTANIELPIKVSDKFTLIPSYRYHEQTEADYFAPYEENLSTQEFYTSDYDLSAFSANQYGIGVRYTDIFTKFKIRGKLGLKNVEMKYSKYDRSNGLSSGIFSLGVKFVLD